MSSELTVFLRTFVRLSITFLILYLIFTNFGTFLIILLCIFAIGYYFFYKLKKKLKEGQANGFKFTFNGQEFNSSSSQSFNFNDFQQQYRQRGGFAGQAPFGEVNDAKAFFGFDHDPSKEEIKRKYKELARKYHPDINDNDDTMMKKLNHYKDVLLQRFS
jgi:hypothetical protein